MRKNAFSVFHVNLFNYFSKIGLFTLFIGGGGLFAQVAVNDTVVLEKNQGTIAIDATVNDILLNSDKTVLTVELGDSAQNARGFSINTTNNQISYQPADGFEGRDTVTYTICDTSLVGACDKADIIYEVGKVPYLPLARNDSSALGQNKVLLFDVTENDTITTTGSMEVRLVTNGTNGIAVVSGDNIEYTPSLDFIGKDTVTYAYCDVFDFAQGGVGDFCDTATLVISVNSLHAQANDSAIMVQPQETLAITGLLDNNIDLENDDLFITDFSSSRLEDFNPVLNTFTYRPGSFVGIDTIPFMVCDTIGQDLNAIPVVLGQCVQDTLFVKVLKEEDNPPPVILSTLPIRSSIFLGETGTITIDATDDQSINLRNLFGFEEGIGFSGVPSAPDVLTFTYTSTKTVSTVDTFTVDVCEVAIPTNCSEVSIIVTITDTAKAPIAGDDFKTIKEGEEAVIEIFNNDEINGSTYSFTEGPANGSFVLDTSNSIAILTYTPEDGFYGNDTIRYMLCRDFCDEGIIVITVEPLFIPLVIEGVSPDSDGINDVFTIEDVDYDLLDVSVKIYNRWGTPVYSESDYNATDVDKSWHGQSDTGGEIVDGTYFYLVEIPELDFKKSGHLVLINKK